MKKILLIRFSSIGDIVLTTPVIRALKQQLNCELHVLTKKPYREIFRKNPYIDQLHSIEKDPTEVLGELKSENFDFVVDLQKNIRSIRLCNKLHRPSASFPKLNPKKWLYVRFKLNLLPDVHIVDRYFEAVKKLEVKNDGLGLDYFIPPEEEVIPETLDKRLENGYIGFVIGGKHNTKILPPEKISSIIEKLSTPVVLLGGPEDKNSGELITSKTKTKLVVNTCGNYSLNQSASLVRKAKLIITNDTGLMHVAAAFKKPVISIWGNTIPKFGMYPYLPGNEHLSFLSEVNDLKCRPCSKLGYNKCPKKHFRCMFDQDENAIVQKVKDFLTSEIPNAKI